MINVALMSLSGPSLPSQKPAAAKHNSLWCLIVGGGGGGRVGGSVGGGERRGPEYRPEGLL